MNERYDRAEDSRQILLRMVESQRKSLRYTQMTCLFLALLLTAVLGLLACVMPSAMGTLRRLDSSLQGVDAMVGSINTMVSNVNAAAGDGENVSDAITSVSDAAASFQETMESFNGAISTLNGAASSVNEAMTKLNGIDFQVLNQAISDLAAAAEPLRQFSALFSR